jgi:hypothetical protein
MRNAIARQRPTLLTYQTMSHDNNNDCITRAITSFNNVGLRFRFGVIVFSSLLSVAALLALVITQSTVTATSGMRRAEGIKPLLEIAFAAGIIGFIPLVLCIVYVCSLEARLLRANNNV